ncbi:hypothetical protein F9891_08425 [Glaesserella parasuis]|uniref:hypothetical protein n=1 Tax=Glaesserella parasuis TaxID=738 RepID=UPI0004A07ECA|nr:hypothetical protein [Glaesserella parasuis]AIK89333.1 hypothetical protein JT17_00455 [Glaesserella parasuis]KDD79095.1 hypothetical protein HPS42_11270 [Glaesserella parasuis ST4-2]MCT8783595.1 hypothetical protein [Glaesserella parasuis]MDG6237899.1 hypothetical protein [Glaesserella parasuis]MDG6274396.1 hypothetical protein [Glaesserella parasuis]
MNLRSIANQHITTVNPNIQATLKLNTGYETSDTGKRVSKFEEFQVSIQAQSLSTQDLSLFDTLAQQGQMLNVYVSGQIHALRRISNQGADKLVFKAFGEESESEWLIKSVSESFPNWCKVVVWRQT